MQGTLPMALVPTTITVKVSGVLKFISLEEAAYRGDKSFHGPMSP
jgi:hypothetical protein